MTTLRFINRNLWLCGVILVLGISMSSCEKKSPYFDLLDRELASGIRYDSIFLGTHFGMTSKDFYAHCWELNKKGIIMEGGSNTTVMWKVDELDYPAAIEFYPVFQEEKVQSMTGYIRYVGWAPWRKETWADKLVVDVKDLFEDWYDVDFIKVPSPGRGDAFTAINGNRRIVLYYTKDERVEMLFTDLTNDDGILTLKNPRNEK